ncbi:hypothetical protein HNR60_001895 [Rhodopseudomonas rhenobacensis]|uniref:Uncharacterized protein n=1 Tax=Rhodopseudomonas rhenobacensis TaxID=87461 RepID=A0A7W7Z3G1_9BRAD|nr:hypothetical protein [Rhodopseudomonas rhenobacensis]MBB5047143.1 hypothetical protein [Rhodopseudomonas rhenobacensis]
MVFLSYLNRFVSNFVLLAVAYYSLNAMDKYQQRAILAFLILIYVAMRAVSALRSFNFFHRIERLEKEARRLGGMLGLGPEESLFRRQIITDVAVIRRSGEMKSYIDLMFLLLIVLICVAKIVTD